MLLKIGIIFGLYSLMLDLRVDCRLIFSVVRCYEPKLEKNKKEKKKKKEKQKKEDNTNDMC